jgi:manganese oxidase
VVDRRDFLKLSAAAVVGASLPLSAGRAEARTTDGGRHAAPNPGRVVTPNGSSTFGREVNGARVFHLVAEPLIHTMTEGLDLHMWGFNGHTPGPTLEAFAGERIRIYVTNHLPAPTSIHWHGIEVPNGMDGVNGLTQPIIAPGATFWHEFELPRPGTFMYHPHADEMTQIGMGMMGAIIVHPRQPEEIDRDFVILLSEFAVRAGRSRPDTTEMVDFNVLAMNSRVFPGTDPLVVKREDRVRVRLINLSQMSHHPIHLHGHVFSVTATEGGPIPREAQWPETTVLVPTGAVREITFVADNPGDWALHCHMLHHVMNQMGHPDPPAVGVNAHAVNEAIRPLIPEFMHMGEAGMAGVLHHGNGHHEAMPMPRNSVAMQTTPGPFGSIEMGGMFTLVKVRDQVVEDDDPGWYEHPEGTVARPATEQELRRDGIEIPGPPDEVDEPKPHPEGDEHHEH